MLEKKIENVVMHRIRYSYRQRSTEPWGPRSPISREYIWKKVSVEAEVWTERGGRRGGEREAGGREGGGGKDSGLGKGRVESIGSGVSNAI